MEKHLGIEHDHIKMECCFPHYGQKFSEVLCDIILKANHTLDIAIFNFMNQDIADAIISSLKNNVQVRIITDKRLSLNPIQYFTLKKLKKAGAKIKKNRHSGSMHLKITIADQKIVTVGSANYTKSAEGKNDEVFMAFFDERVGMEFDKQFNLMWNLEYDFRYF